MEPAKPAANSPDPAQRQVTPLKQQIRRIGQLISSPAEDRKPEPPAAPEGRELPEEMRQTFEAIIQNLENANERAAQAAAERPWPFTSWKKGRKG